LSKICFKRIELTGDKPHANLPLLANSLMMAPVVRLVLDDYKDFKKAANVRFAALFFTVFFLLCY
jgi:hypothetical protein